MKINIFTFGKRGLYLVLQPVLSPFTQTRLRTENVKLIYTASFSGNRLSGYNFPADLASHLQLPNERTILNHIKLFPKYEVSALA